MLARLLPERCPVCGEGTSEAICDACRASFALVDDPCPTCGLSAPVLRCPQRAGEWQVQRVVAPLRYEYPLDRYIHALKFMGERRMGRALGLLLASHVERRGRAGAVDAIVAVPLHRGRLIERGYNQALEIARPLASALDRPVLLAGISRRRPTAPQSTLRTGRRKVNVAGAFTAARDLRGRAIAVVDDVITTGATVNALAAALRGAGAREVHAWSVARAAMSEARTESNLATKL